MSNARDIADAGHQLAAWVNFNGTGTVAIRASYNVASITDNGTGNYTVNFSTAMPDTNYCAVSMPSRDVGETTIRATIYDLDDTKSTTSLQIRTVDVDNSNVNDQAFVSVAIFR